MVQRRRAAALAASGCVLAVASAAAATGATAEPARASQKLTMSLGWVLGGSTSQEFPVVVQIDNPANVRRVVGVAAAIRLECASGGGYTVPDEYRRLKVAKRGRFQASFGPDTHRDDDDVEGSIQGTFNAARDRVRGAWRFEATEHDAGGAVTDTCESGRITWSARQ